jgi:hypothetical protein
MKELTGKWKIKKDGTWAIKYKKRKVRPLSILDIAQDSE